MEAVGEPLATQITWSFRAGFRVVSPHIAPAPHPCPWSVMNIGAKAGGRAE